MAEPVPNIEDLIKEAKDLYEKEYGSAPKHCAIGPGRVNLIGEHTDYNNGFVLPMALPLVTVAVGSMTQEGVFNICTKSDTAGEDPKVTGIKPSAVEKGSPK